jgi:ComF family protein
MGVIDWLYPRKCVGCGRLGRYFCERCLEELRWQLKGICPECGKESFGGEVHLGCRNKYGLDGLVSLLSYQGLVRAGVYSLKYKLVRDLEPELREIIMAGIGRIVTDRQGKRLRRFLGQRPGVAAVPLHWRRSNWRGFNQAELVARIVADSLGLEMLMGVMERKRQTKVQARLGQSKRRENVRQAFRIKEGVRLRLRMLVVDDVWTTGETMKAVGRELKKAGVKEVWGLSLAR